MNSLTDEQKKLVEENVRLAYYMAQKWMNQLAPRRFDPDELRSLCALALCKAARAFDEEKGVKFATFAARCMDNEVLMVLRKEKHNWRFVSLEQPITEDLDDGNALTVQETLSDPQDDIEAWIILETIPVLLKTLQDRERTIMERIYFSDEAQRSVGADLGLSQSYVSRIRRKALDEMKKAAEKNQIAWF